MVVAFRLTRASLIESLSHDYARTARSKGLRERNVVAVHAARNAMLPVLTVVGLELGSLLGGALGTALGLRQAVLVSAIGLFVPSLILILSPARRVRRLDEAAQAAAEPHALEPSLHLDK